MAVKALIIPTYTHQYFDYNVPDGTKIGAFANVTFNRRVVIAVVSDKPIDTKLAPHKIKDVNFIYDTPPLKEDFLAFLDFISFYYMAPLNFCLKLAIPHKDIISAPNNIDFYYINPNIEHHSLSKKRQAIYSFLLEYHQATKNDIAAQTGVSKATINAMISDEQLCKKQQKPPPPPKPNPNYPGAWQLEAHQQQALDAMQAAYKAQQFIPYILQGTTGSGKTIIYLEFLASILRKGLSALILVPEITLSYNVITLFEKRFGVTPIIWHSALTQAQKKAYYYRILTEDNLVVIGARSALFMPIRNLGLIIVDEEHDQTYKQESHIRYQARDMAVKRAQNEHIMVLLVSATLSIETQVNWQQQKYQGISVTNRAQKAALPDIRYIDLCKNPPENKKQFISPILEQAVKDTYAKNEQILLFINKRGYAPIIVCTNCGHQYTCPHCDAHLVSHKLKNKMICHFCMREYNYPTHCETCADDHISNVGIGVERIAEEVAEKFPDINYAIVTSDTVNNTKKITKILQDIKEKNIHMLIGTQILAKGHHIEDLTLVGILDADIVQSLHDPRMLERQYHLLKQCAGRAGRAQKKGTVYMQAYKPDNSLLQALQHNDDEAFIAREIEQRQKFSMPPFARLMAVMVQGKDNDYCQKIAKALQKSQPNHPDIQIIGGGASSIRYINDIFRYRFMIITRKEANTHPIIQQWCAPFMQDYKVQIIIDVDPYSFY